jgi:Xaa-Pro aminopeptidase
MVDARVHKVKSDSRIIALKELAESKKCTHILVSDPVDAEYISGFKSSNAFLLVSAEEQLLFTDFRYSAAAHTFCMSNPEWRFIESAENGFAVIGNHVPPGSCAGIQSDSLTVDKYDCIRALWKNVSFTKLGDAVSLISTVKTDAEIKNMARAARIADYALKAFYNRIKIGISEKEAADILEEECRSRGSEGPSFPSIVLFGARSALPHGRPSAAKLRRGDWILCDFGCTVNGLCSDMTRTAVVGAADKKQKLVYDVVCNAQKNAVQKVLPGRLSCEIDSAARSVITEAGYGKAFGHATGHGVGRRIHEKPRIAAKDKTALQTNMVITVEPGIYIDDFGGVRIEDMAAVSDTGCHILTRFTKKLLELKI